MSTKFLSPGWRMPRNANQSKSANYSLDLSGAKFIDCGTSVYDKIRTSSGNSVAGWFKIDNLASGDILLFNFRLPFSGNAIQRDYAFYWSTNATSNIKIYVDNSAKITYSNFSPVAGVWYHACVSVEYGTDTTKQILYINGQNVATASSAITSLPNQTSNLYINQWYSSTWSAIQGSFSDISIFDYALSESQVTTLWGGGTEVSNPMALPRTPIAYYPLGTSAWNGQYLAENNAIGDYVFDITTTSQRFLTPLNAAEKTNLTYSVWFKTSSGINSNKILFSSGRYGTFQASMYTNQIIVTAQVYTGSLTGSSTSATINFSYGDNKWHHYVLNFDGSHMKFYIDGVLKAKNAKSGVLNYHPNSLRDTGIGNTSYVSSNAGLVGEYSNFISHNATLTDGNVSVGDTATGEIATLYNYGSPIQDLSSIPQSSNIESWYKLDASEIYNSSITDWEVDNALSPWTSSLNLIPNDYVQTGGFTIGNNYTFSCWLKSDTTSPSNMCFLSSPNYYNVGYNGNFVIRLTSATQIQVYSYNGTADSESSTVTIPSIDTNWHHFALTSNGTTTNIYWDGSPLTVTGNQTKSLDNISQGLIIGHNITGNNNAFNGEISNVQIFNSALPATGSNSVETLYNYGSPIQTLANIPQNSNLQGWWKLDASDTYDGTNWTIEDHAGSNDGTSSGMTQANLVQSDLSFTSGYSPYALDFDGTNDYIDCGDSDDFSFGDGSTDSPFSVSAWVNPDAVEYAGIVAKYVTGGWEWLLYLLDNNFLKFLLLNNNTSGNSIGLTTDVAIPINTWTHVSATYNANGEPNGIDLYINGSLQSLVTESTSGTYQAMTNTTAPLQIGTWNGNFRPINGQISNVSIWDVKLTPTQVSEIYNEGVPQNLLNHSAVSSLVSWWQLGSNSSFNTNWTVLDEKGSNNGTSVNMNEGDIVDGVGSYANGLSSGMGGDEVIGSAPFSDANSLSVNMDVEDRVTDTPS